VTRIPPGHNPSSDTPLAGLESPIDALRETGSFFHDRGWSVGTSSNYSVILEHEPLDLLVTASGMDKGHLSRSDFVRVGSDGVPLFADQPKSSAETMLHVVLARDPNVGAVLHTHSIWCTLLSDLFADRGGLEIEGYEMLKGLAGIPTHEHRKWVEIFTNTQDIQRLSEEVAQRLDDRVNPLLHGFMIRRHGLYTWGKDLAEARRHIEIFEFLFECIARRLAFEGTLAAPSAAFKSIAVKSIAAKSIATATQANQPSPLDATLVPCPIPTPQATRSNGVAQSTEQNGRKRMTVVSVFNDNRRIEDRAEIEAFLAPYGIWYEKWDVSGRLKPDATNEDILTTYAPEIERLKERGDFLTADVINVTPKTPNIDEMMAKFAKEHTHSEDEVRFTVEGGGIFHIHADDGTLFAIQIGPGDLINVPRGVKHWFRLCNERSIRCIRLFQDPAGWTTMSSRAVTANSSLSAGDPSMFPVTLLSIR